MGRKQTTEATFLLQEMSELLQYSDMVIIPELCLVSFLKLALILIFREALMGNLSTFSFKILVAKEMSGEKRFKNIFSENILNQNPFLSIICIIF